MALVVKDRVQETTTTAGTGTLTLGGAVLGFQTFATIGNGNTTYYTISDPTTGDWEVGIGTYTSSGTTLSRDTVLSSSNAGSLVTFGSGTKNVFCTYPSSRSVYLDQPGAYPVQNTFDTLTAATATLAAGTVNHIPSTGTDIANKAYVDTLSTGLHIHTPVLVAETSNLTATYADGGTTPTWTTITNTSEIATGSAHGLSAGAVIVFANVGASGLTAGTAYFVKSAPTSTSITVSLLLNGPTVTTLVNNTGYSITSRANSGVGATLTNAGTQAALVIDTVSLASTNRVLVQGQTSGFQNGVYTVTTVGSGSTNWVLTRATDANTYDPRSDSALGEGDYFFVTSGSAAKGDSFVLSTSGTIVFGTTSLTFNIFSDNSPYLAGTGLTLTGQTFSITNTGTAGTYGAANSVPVFTTNAQGQVTNVTPTSIAITSGAVSGLAASATTDTTNASNISSGTLGTSRLSGSYTGVTGVGTLTAGTWNASTIGATYGGTGQSSYAVGDLVYADTTTSLAKLADVATGNALISGGVGAAPSYGKIGLATHVSGTLPVANGGTGVTSSTGSGSVVLSTSPTLVTPALGTPSSGDFSTGTFTWPTFNQNTTGTAAGLSSTLVATSGGTGQSSYAVGDLLYASTTTALSKLADVATGNALISGGVNTAPSWGKVGLTTHVSGTLPIANGGTNSTATPTNGGVTYGTGTAQAYSAAGTSGQVLTSAGAASPTWTTATNANTASAIVQRDASGNFSAGTITASLTGTATTATTANALNTANNYQVANLGVGIAPNGVNGDITAARNGGATGVIFFGNSGARYLYYDGGTYYLNGASLNVSSISGNAATATTATNGITITSGTYTTNYGLRAWVNFNGVGGASIRASANTSSVTRNSTGDYTLNFSTAMPDGSYAGCGSTGTESGSCFITPFSGTNASSGWRFNCTDRNISFSFRDQSNVMIHIAR